MIEPNNLDVLFICYELNNAHLGELGVNGNSKSCCSCRGLLGGHLMADFVKRKLNKMLWYSDDLLNMATDLGDRLLPAFNTSTGMPYPRVSCTGWMNE